MTIPLSSPILAGLCGLSLMMSVVTLTGAVRTKILWQRLTLGLLAGCSLCLAGIVALSIATRPRLVAAKCACIANLKQIEGAKATWALEFKKTQADMPGDKDLFGSGRYIPVKPNCPQGGSYRIGAVGQKPACSIGGAGHQLDE